MSMMRRMDVVECERCGERVAVSRLDLPLSFREDVASDFDVAQ